MYKRGRGNENKSHGSTEPNETLEEVEWKEDETLMFSFYFGPGAVFSLLMQDPQRERGGFGVVRVRRQVLCE